MKRRSVSDILRASTFLTNARQCTESHIRILNKKRFLRMLYQDWYLELKKSLDDSDGTGCVELGTGGGMSKAVMPCIVTSDIILLPHIDICLSAVNLPFRNESVKAFLLLDVLHHIKDAEGFFQEAQRSLIRGGRIVMIEPASTVLSRVIWRFFHHETYDDKADWCIKGENPLFSANSALPWIIFIRDKDKFLRMYPCLKITCMRIHTPLRYLLSGGFSMNQIAPDFSYGFFKKIETCLSRFNRYIGMFLTVEIEKI